MADAFIITGASGFIGMHVCRALDEGPDKPGHVAAVDIAPSSYRGKHQSMIADIREGNKLRDLARKPTEVLLHLAAKAEVVLPFAEFSDLVSTNIGGTVKILEIINPRKVVFASSSSVYGNTSSGPAAPSGGPVGPLGAYGMSKALGELICERWAAETGGTAVMLRLGNVVGAGCRGLIPYLVRHAMKYPDGSIPAEMRGNGEIIRDYVPVCHVVKVMLAAAENDGKPGISTIYNVGTGRGTTNGRIAAVVQRLLRESGYTLNIRYDNPLAHGEATTTLLHVGDTVRAFGYSVPTERQVEAAIEQATMYALENQQ